MFIASLAVLALCMLPVEESPTEPQSILGGTVVEACGWPNVVSMAGSCSGTLIHPEVVLYAAHCGDVIPWIRFGDTIEGATREVVPERCEVHPIGSFGFGTDYAYCLLSEPITDVPITPPLMGCDVDEMLVIGESATIVGFGQSDDPDEPYGIKREVTTEITGLSWDEVFVGDAEKGACYGDSGGPVLVQLDDGTWRTFGVTSWGKPGCGAGNYFSLVHLGVEWVETETGIDVTPCHDTLGNWDPSPACGGFATGSPGVAEGTWDSCSWAEVSGLSSTCGGAFDETPDRDAPVVTVVEPVDGARYNSLGGGVELGISVGVEDVGWGAESVTMRVVDDGEVLFEAEDLSAPFLFPPLNFADGVWTVEAEAVDRAGNVGVSEPVTFGVNTDPPTPAATTSGTGGDGSGGTSGEPGETGDTDADGIGSSSGDGSGTSGGPSIDEEGGCGCRSGGSGASGIFGLAILGLLRRRRRARSSAGAASALALGALSLAACGDDSVSLSATESSTSGGTSTGEGTSEGESATVTGGGETSGGGGETSSGGVEPVCGNGQIDGAEELCDDGNAVDGDGCNADCTPSGAELERYEGFGSGWIGDIQIDPAGNIYVVGQDGAQAAARAWLAKLDPAGAPLWDYVYPESVTSSFSDLVVEDGRAVAAGWVRPDMTDSLLVVLDSAEGDVISSDVLVLDEDEDGLTDLALAGEEVIVLAVLGADALPVVYSLGEELTPTWTYEPKLEEARLGALDRTADGHTLAVFGEQLDPSTRGLFVVKLDDEGGLVWSAKHSDPLTRYRPRHIIAAADGRSVVCGELSRTEASDAFLLGLDAGGAELWRARVPVEGPGFDWCTSVSITDDGSAVFAGSGFTPNNGWEARVGKVDLETGQLRWQRTLGSEGSIADYGGEVAPLPGGELLVGALLGGNEADRTLIRLSP